MVGYTRYKDKEQKSKAQEESRYLEVVVRGWWSWSGDLVRWC